MSLHRQMNVSVTTSDDQVQTFVALCSFVIQVIYYNESLLLYGFPSLDSFQHQVFSESHNYFLEISFCFKFVYMLFVSVSMKVESFVRNKAKYSLSVANHSSNHCVLQDTAGPTTKIEQRGVELISFFIIFAW